MRFVWVRLWLVSVLSEVLCHTLSKTAEMVSIPKIKLLKDSTWWSQMVNICVYL